MVAALLKLFLFHLETFHSRPPSHGEWGTWIDKQDSQEGITRGYVRSCTMKASTLSKYYPDQIKQVGMTSIVSLFVCMLSIVSAQAAPRDKIITVIVQGDGTVTSVPAGISCPTDCTEFNTKERYVTLMASAVPDGKFLGWEGACVGVEPICKIRLKKSNNVTALFVELPDAETTINSDGDLPETDIVLEQATTTADTSAEETVTIKLGWPAFSVD
jgi:hypothetical protein